AEREWPLARTEYRKLFLDASAGALRPDRPERSDSVRYDPLDQAGEAVFDHRFETETELTGYMKLKLWVEAEGTDDMDLFVAIQKLDRDGNGVGFIFYAFYDNGPVALGW